MIRRIYAAVIVVLTLGMVGNMDYADALNMDAEEKLTRPLRVLDASMRPADGDECERALGARPDATISRQDRSTAPYYNRWCYYSNG